MQPVAIVRVVAAVALRPDLWPTAVHQLRLLARPGWWWHPPFLPVPERNYLAFRLVTQYGDERHPPVAADVVSYLAWCRAFPSGRH